MDYSGFLALNVRSLYTPGMSFAYSWLSDKLRNVLMMIGAPVDQDPGMTHIPICMIDCGVGIQ
jgi:hypothetical protein